MAIVEILDEKESKDTFQTMKPGQYAKVNYSSKEIIVYKTYDGYITMLEKANGWTCPHVATECTILPKGTVIKITI